MTEEPKVTAGLFEVPITQRAALAKFAVLSQEKLGALVETVREAHPQYVVADFAPDLGAKIGFSGKESRDLLEALANMYITYDRSRLDLPTFVDRVIASMRAFPSSNQELGRADWPAIQRTLGALLRLEGSLGVTAKAEELLIENQHNFCTARIVTDLRPVFKRNVEEPPAAMLVVHKMRLTHHVGANEETRDFVLTMTKHNLVVLRELIDRALSKEKSLHDSTERVPVIGE